MTLFCGGWHTIANLNRNKKIILVGGSSAHLTLSFPMPPKPSDPRLQALLAIIWWMCLQTFAVLFCPFEHDLRTRRGPSVGLFSKTSLLLWNAPLWKKSAMNKTTDYARSWKMSPLHKPISSNIRPNVNGHHFFLESMTHYIIKVGLHQLLCSSGLHRYCNACVSFTAEVVGREQWCWLSVNK